MHHPHSLLSSLSSILPFPFFLLPPICLLGLLVPDGLFDNLCIRFTCLMKVQGGGGTGGMGGGGGDKFPITMSAALLEDCVILSLPPPPSHTPLVARDAR
jgi:hypothetical protein